ncbi:hypothetical protein IAT38_008088 [Cryptococcus sp. DSM 104549]
MFSTPLLSILLALPAVLSTPLPQGPRPGRGFSGGLTSPITAITGDISSIASISSGFKNIIPSLPKACSVSAISVPLASAATLVVPSGEKSSAIAVGQGIQNYTCTSGAYVSTGALANLFDVSCLYSLTAGKVDSAQLSTQLPQIAFNMLKFPDAGPLPVAIHHLFVNTPGSTTAGAISPEFVGASDKVVLSKVTAQDAPTDPATNVPWLQLKAIDGQGTLSKSVYRINTVKGQPPTSCTNEGESLSVPYAALYWFTK